MNHHPARSTRPFGLARFGLLALALAGCGGRGADRSSASPKVKGGPLPDRGGSGADYRLAVGGYPKTDGDPGNTCQGGGRGATGAAGRTAQVGTAPVYAVVVDGKGTVYAGSGGTVAAVSRGGGALWRATVAGTIVGLLVTRGGQVIVSAAKLTSLNGGGAVDWTFPDDFKGASGSVERPYAANVTPEGTVILATPSRVYALDPSARTVRWSSPFKSVGRPTLTSGSNVVLMSDDEVRGLDAATGALTFSWPKTPTVAPPTASASTVGKTYHVSGSFGLTALPCAAGSAVALPEATYDGTATGAQTRSMDGKHWTYYYRYNLSDTLYLRSLSPGSTTSTILTSVRGTSTSFVYSAIPEPTAIAKDASGRFLLTYDYPTTSTFSTQGWSVAHVLSRRASVGSDGTVYVATQGESPGHVEAIDSTSGTVRWIATLPAAGTGLDPAIGPDGSLYVGTLDGRVMQIR